MTTPKQIEANRLNAQKSTGPKTPKGKRRSSWNRTKHGLYSKDIVINSSPLKEDRQQYNRLLQTLIQDFKPSNGTQKLLLQRLANAMWRSQRVITAETSRISLNADDPWFERSPDSEARRKTELVPITEGHTKLIKFERHLDRQINEIFLMYRRLKKMEEKSDEKNNK